MEELCIYSFSIGVIETRWIKEKTISLDLAKVYCNLVKGLQYEGKKDLLDYIKDNHNLVIS